MGLFDKRDKKRKDEFDSPVDRIDLSSMSSDAEPEPAAAAAAPAAAAPAAAPAALSRAAAPPPAADVDDYGIDKAIELMRTLPSENVELVVQVVKFSLESVGIQLPVIIEDAIRRQNDLQGRVVSLRAEIADLEQEIKLRKEEIDRLEADHRETTTVRERLELAEKLGKTPGGKDAPAKSEASGKDAKGDSGPSGLPHLGPRPTRGNSPTGSTSKK